MGSLSKTIGVRAARIDYRLRINVAVQLDELERNKVAPDATTTMNNKCQNSAVYVRFFTCVTVHPEPPKLRVGGVEGRRFESCRSGQIF